MHTAKGSISELTLEDGSLYARVSCPENLIPAPGQYLLASDGSGSPLPVPMYYTDSVPGGFITLSADHWKPGDELYLRGPLGRGFSLPLPARKVALVAFDDVPARLRGLIAPALNQDASVVLVTSSNGDALPDEVEVQPLAAMEEILRWADFVALDVSRENLSRLRERLLKRNQPAPLADTQILIRASMPCGGIADCGVCAVTTKSSWKMACKDGPVFDWKEI